MARGATIIGLKGNEFKHIVTGERGEMKEQFKNPATGKGFDKVYYAPIDGRFSRRRGAPTVAKKVAKKVISK